jgi:WD40 repeat protein
VSPSRRLRPRPATRFLVSAAVLSLTVALTAATPASAVYVPPNVTSTLVTANPADNTPHLQNGSMRAFAQIGNTVYAGGSFTGVKNAGATTWSTASYLIAYDATTGVLKTGFTPELDNAVQTLAVSPDGKLFVGGNFTTVNGVSRKNLVELDPGTGDTVAAWVGRADGGVVRRAIVKGNYLYLAGAFHYVNGAAHSLLARLNATTGAIDASFQIDASVARASTELVWALAVSPDGKTVVATGNFKKVNGLAREQVVMIDVSATPTVADWSTQRYLADCTISSFPFYARDVDFSDDGSYFVIGADGGTGGDAFCDTISRWETSARGSNLDATWVDRTGHDSVTSLEAADNVVYLGGHFRWLNNANGNDSAGPGAVDRYGYGALDPNNGLPMAWNPGRSPGTQLPAGGTDWGPIVWEIWKGPNGLFVGQDSDGVGNEYHGREAYFPTSGGRTVAAVDAPQAASGYLYLGAGNGKLTKVSYGAAGIGTPKVTTQTNLTSAKSTFVLSNRLYWAKTDSKATSGSLLEVSTFSAGTVGAPWLGSGFNAWYKAANMTGAFYLGGRMYYTTSSTNSLFYRYLEPDGSIVGCTEFTLPTSGIDWRTVRGMTWVAGKLVYGSTDGKLRTVAFSPAAATAVTGANTKVVASGTTAANWNNATLFFATS